MTREQWTEIVKGMIANWPHAEIPDVSLAKWWDDLKGQEPQVVDAAIESYYRDGREFPPNGGQILARIRELSSSEVDHGEAWALVGEANRRFGLHVEHGQAEAMAWLRQRSHAVAEAVRRFGPDSLATYNLQDEGTVRAQFRDIFKAVCEEGRKADLHPVLPRGDGEPKRIGEVIGEIPDRAA